MLQAVIPAQAGIHNMLKLLDSRLRGNDKNGKNLLFVRSLKIVGKNYSNIFLYL